MKFLAIIFLIVGLQQPVFGQQYSFKKKQSSQKGALYLYWGYNRSIYAKSDIHFTGDGYDFTILKAKATDNPSKGIKTYLNPISFTVPQFNVRMGYYYKNNWDISFGYDHMKYVMTINQVAALEGYIDPGSNDYISGQFNNQFHTITPKMIQYENSNGLNYFSAQLTNTKSLYRTKSRKIRLQRRLGIGLGALVTQTDFNWSAKDYHSELKITGMGASLHTGLRLDFFNRLFLQSNWSSGLLYLPKLRTIANTESFASQKFVYADWQLVGGVVFYLRTKNGCGSCPDW